MEEAPLPPLYRIAVFTIPEDRSELAELLVEHLSLLPTDGAIQARNLPGVITGEFPGDTAERAVRALAAAGLQAQAVPADAVPHLHPFEVPHHLRWPAEALEICGLSGEVESRIPWGHVDLISVGQVPLDSSRHHTDRQTTVVAAGRHHVPEGDSNARLSPGPEAWIVCSQPDRVLKLDHKKLNYEHLGVNKSESATANFRHFLVELVERASTAYLTPATVAFLAGDLAQRFSFPGSTDLERATLVHLLIRRSRLNSTAPPTPAESKTSLPAAG